MCIIGCAHTASAPPPPPVAAPLSALATMDHGGSRLGHTLASVQDVSSTLRIPLIQTPSGRSVMIDAGPFGQVGGLWVSSSDNGRIVWVTRERDPGRAPRLEITICTLG
jgi:hypothetical protein